MKSTAFRQHVCPVNRSHRSFPRAMEAELSTSMYRSRLVTPSIGIVGAVGETVGYRVGDVDGESVVGNRVGLSEGANVGAGEGANEGAKEGPVVTEVVAEDTESSAKKHSADASFGCGNGIFAVREGRSSGRTRIDVSGNSRETMKCFE